MPREVEQVKLVVTLEEKLRIQKNAKLAGVTVSAYIRMMALNLCILKYDTSDIVNEHVHEISSLRNAINQLIYTIMKMGDYSPAYLEDIYGLMLRILNSEKSFFVMMEKDILKKQKLFKSEIKAIVDARLKLFEKPKQKDEKTKKIVN